ncbi:MAG TPA: hypothetical protein VLA92_02055 [Candidatus Saccharimonadales bacterium]|nr:hypothetical protein [Candidatus Saccharimonadales bacterium]
MPDSRKPTKIGNSVTATHRDVEHYFQVLEKARPALEGDSQKKIDINQEIARDQKIKNDNAEQDIGLKRITLNRLFWFLAIETFLIFAFAFFQSIGWPHGFHLEEWSFRLVVGATIAQITGMLFVAVRYLFPNK